MQNPDKPFKTFTEQVDCLLGNHQLPQNGHESHQQMEKILRIFPYYDLVNGYKEATMCGEYFQPDVSFGLLYLLYIFDHDIQSILLKQSLYIENSFKTKLSYVISEHYGVDIPEYMDPANYDFSDANSAVLFNNLSNYVSAMTNGRLPYGIPSPTSYYLHHHNHVPAWILIKNVSFSSSVDWFRILPFDLQKEVFSLFFPFRQDLSEEAQIDFLIKSLTLIRKFRNSMAHTLKFVTHKASYQERNAPAAMIKFTSRKLLNWPDLKKRRCGLSDVYAYICLCTLFLGTPALTSKFCKELYGCITPLDDSEQELSKNILFGYYAKITNLPTDLSERLENYMKSLPY